MSTFGQSAFEKLQDYSNPLSLLASRDNLISMRGSLVNGNLPGYTELVRRANNNPYSVYNSEEPAVTTGSVQLSCMRLPNTSANYGFVFTKEGTERIIRTVINNSPLAIFQDFRDYIRFQNDEKASLWANSSDQTKKRLILNNMNSMIRQTNMQYRIHGDRLHYLVIGRVIADVQNVASHGLYRASFPLFLFSCQDTNLYKMHIEVEQRGFLNFALDKNILDSKISQLIQADSVDMTSDLPMTLAKIQQHLAKINIPNVDNIEVDTTFSMIGVITGFETEYLDSAWEEMLSSARNNHNQKEMQ